MNPKILTLFSFSILLTSCSPVITTEKGALTNYNPNIPYYYQQAFDGVVFPMECRKDLSFITTPVSYVPEKELVEMYETDLKVKFSPKGTIWGIYVKHLFDKRWPLGIYINSDATQQQQIEALHHERCHVLLPGWIHKGS